MTAITIDTSAITKATSWGWREKTMLVISLLAIATLTAFCFAYAPVKNFATQKVGIWTLLVGYTAILLFSGLVFYRLGNRNGGKELEAVLAKLIADANQEYASSVAKIEKDRKTEVGALTQALELQGTVPTASDDDSKSETPATKPPAGKKDTATGILARLTGKH